MKKSNEVVTFSATGLVNYVGSKHLTELDWKNAMGTIDAPDWQNPALAFLQQKVEEHESAYVAT